MGSRVTIDFSLTSEAEAFSEWIAWVDSQTEQQELILTPTNVRKQ
jgi:hypothetical protein